jgi:hypothetical protein
MKVLITCACGEIIERMEFQNGYDTENIADICEKCGTKTNVELRVSVVTKEDK